MGLDTVWVGTCWGILNVSLCASGGQLRLDYNFAKTLINERKRNLYFRVDVLYINLSLTYFYQYSERCTGVLVMIFISTSYTVNLE